MNIYSVPQFNTDISLVRRVVTIETYRWNGTQNDLQSSVPIACLESSTNPVDSRTRGFVSQTTHGPSLPPLPPPPGPVPDLETILQMLERRRESTSVASSPQQPLHFFTTRNAETKASIVERFQRTLKTRMWRYFTRHKTRRYVNILPNLVYAYNHSYHRSIKRDPAEVNASNDLEV